MKRICIVAGARPNFMKVAPLLRAFDKAEGAECQLVYAGRADDATLEDSLFDDLQMRRPDFFLGVDSTSLNEITSQVMAQFDAHLEQHPADVVIVVDDLASTMAAAIVTKKRGIQLAHLVAGTRSFDINMPKEINRLVIDALSDYLFTAGIKSNSVAAREQGDGGHTYMVGNILMDTLRFNRNRLQQPAIDVAEGQYLLLTLNRKALLNDADGLKAMIGVVEQKAQEAGVPVVASLRDMAREKVAPLLSASSAVRLCSSFPYLEFGWLVAHAKGIITDSGNVAEEATFNGVPCITLNSYTEHQETVSVGTNVLVGGDSAKLGAALSQLLKGQWKPSGLPDRWDGRTSERIVQILLP